MELAFRLLIVVAVLIVVLGIPFYLCIRGMVKQAKLGNVDRTKRGKTLTGLGLTIFVSIVPVMLYRQSWIFAVGFAAFSGILIIVGRTAGESVFGNRD